MSIQELSLKFKGFFGSTEVQLSALIIAVGLTAFMIGRASVGGVSSFVDDKEHIVSNASVASTRELHVATSTAGGTVSSDEASGYVASKSGTKYHLPWCGGAKQIKEENKIWFATKEEAEKAGYTPASNCKGI